MNILRGILHSFIPLLLVLAAVLGGVVYLENVAVSHSRLPLRVNVTNPETSEVDSVADAESVGRTEWLRQLSTDTAFTASFRLFREGKYSRALDGFVALLNVRPDHPFIEFYAGVAALKMQRNTLAVRHLESSIAHAPTFAPAYVHCALARRNLYSLRAAESLLVKAVSLDTTYAFGYYQLGVVLNRLRRPDSALVVLDFALRMSATGFRAFVHNEMGVAWSDLRNNGKATTAFEQAIQYRPSYIEPRLNLSRLYPATGPGADMRKKLLTDILALKPGYAPAYVELGRLAYAARDIASSAQYFQRAVREDPLLTEARAGLGMIMLESGQSDNAQQMFLDLVRSDSLAPQNHFHLARLNARKENYRLATELYAKAIALADGFYPEAWLNQGVMYERLDNPDSALLCYQRALVYEPNYDEANYNIGALYAQMGDPAKARLYFAKAVASRPDYRNAWYNLGLLHAKAGSLDSAAACYRRAIAADSSYLKAHLNLATVLADNRDTIAALREYRWITSRFPSYTSAWFNMARILSTQGKSNDAVAAYLRLLQADPENKRARQNLGVLYARLGRSEDAIHTYKESLARDPADEEVRFNLALQYRKTNRLADAAAELKKSLSLKPDYAKASKQLALVLRTMGDSLTAVQVERDAASNRAAASPAKSVPMVP